MSNNAKYLTTGVQKNVPLELQLFMWNCISTLKEKNQQLDYLQVFELTKQRDDGIFFQKIEHRQEIPEYKKTYNVFPAETVDAKIFVIDDGEYSSMLLSEEY